MVNCKKLPIFFQERKKSNHTLGKFGGKLLHATPAPLLSSLPHSGRLVEPGGHSGLTGPKCNYPPGRIRVSSETHNRPRGPAGRIRVSYETHNRPAGTAFGHPGAGAGWFTTITATRLLWPKANDSLRQVTTNTQGPKKGPRDYRRFIWQESPWQEGGTR